MEDLNVENNEVTIIEEAKVADTKIGKIADFASVLKEEISSIKENIGDVLDGGKQFAKGMKEEADDMLQDMEDIKGHVKEFITEVKASENLGEVLASTKDLASDLAGEAKDIAKNVSDVMGHTTEFAVVIGRETVEIGEDIGDIINAGEETFGDLELFSISTSETDYSL